MTVPVQPGRFGDCGREILAIAHQIPCRRPWPAMFVRQVHGEFFIHWLNEQNERARLNVRWEDQHGWVFSDMGTYR